jgi:class 3 adenylate cyclase
MELDTASPPEPRPSESVDGLAQFVEALKSESELANQPTGELAKRFGLSDAVVESIFQELSEPQSEGGRSIKIIRAVRSALRSSVALIQQSWLSATESPYVFIVVAFALIGLLQAGMTRFAPPAVADPVNNFVLLAGLVAILGCIVRWGRVGVAAFAAFVMFCIFFGLALVAPAKDAARGQVIAGGVVGGFGFGSIVLLLGIVAAFVGHVVREQKLTRRERRMSRQELLDRAFQLQAKFDRERSADVGASPMSQVAEAFREHGQYPLVAVILALALGCLRVAVISSVGEVVIRFIPFNWFFIFGLLYTFFVITVGYFAPSPRLATAAMLLTLVGFTLPVGLPQRRGFGLTVLTDEIVSPRFWIVAALVFGASVVIGAVLKANRSEMRRRRLNANDPSTLAAEIVRTHWRLYGRQRSLVVLVVDVAGSTTMKAGADPGRVEYSFRAYQHLIAEVTRENHGKVVSTAGDGAVCSFADAASALSAARELQTRMSEFNAAENRLGTPFRVRIGIHAGETGVDLAAAPFNQVIDVAAHVERVAPVGGIALTEAVASRLPNEGLVELAAKVDNHHVSVVLNPTRVLE